MLRLKHYEIEGEHYDARSIKEAKEKHQAYVRATLKAAKMGTLVIAGATRAIIIYPQDGGTWCYSFLDPIPGSCAVAYVSTCCGNWTDRRAAELAARRHLAQIEENISFIDPNDDEGRCEHVRYFAWQDRYRKAKAAGMNDQQAHECASRAA